MRGFVLGFFLGIVALAAGVFLYLRAGHPPVAVDDPPFKFEKKFVSVPLHARINAEMPKEVPIQADETNLAAGAAIYHKQCAVCHGVYGQPLGFGAHMYPPAPHLWEKDDDGVMGVSDDPAGETYWKVANGIRLTGMPAFNKTLSETEMWQVTVLLANGGKPLPDSVTSVLKEPLNLDAQLSAAPAH